MVGICVHRLIEADEETGQVRHFVQRDALISLNVTCVMPVIPFNSEQMRLWEVTACKCAPLLVKVSLNPLPAPSIQHFGMTLSPRQWRCCCPKLLLLKANRTRTALLCQGCRSHLGHWCLTFFSDVTPSVALTSLAATSRNTVYTRRKLHDLGRCYQWFVCSVQK